MIRINKLLYRHISLGLSNSVKYKSGFINVGINHYHPVVEKYIV